MNKNRLFQQVELSIRGMTWMGWEPKVVRALEGLSGVKKAAANFSEKTAIIQYDPDSVTISQINDALLKAGYVASQSERGKQDQIFIPRSDEKNEFQGKDLVCFCFEYTRNDIERDYIENRYSTILAKIAAEKKAGGCDCATKNPKGRWCLADVRQVVDQIKQINP